MRKKILIAAGGSGGHLFPAQQLAHQLQESSDVLIVGHNVGASPFFLKKIPFQDISAVAPKKGQYLRFIFASCKGLLQSIRIILRFSPDVVVGFGSYHTFPVLLASAIFRKKIVLFEANCILGQVNRLFAPVAKKIAIQFPLAQPLSKSVLVPLLPWGKKGSEKSISREDARIYFGLHPHRTTLLIFGGSQGASFFNEIMPKVILPGIQVIHCTGKGSVIYPNGNACVKEFEKRMDLAYMAADVVVCRSGAGTLSELIRYKKPSLLIPYPFATDNHQLVNARFLVNQVKGARLLEQSQATCDHIAQEVGILLNHILLYQAALENWKTEGRTDLAEVCYE